MKDLKATLIQFDIIWENKQANFDKIEHDFFANLKSSETDLIVLPEMFATGFTMRPSEFFEDENGPTYSWLKHWATALNVTIAAGLITKNVEGQYLNTCVWVKPTGAIEDYCKRHLFRMGEENNHYKSGVSPAIVNINGWKINLQICYDLRFPVFARNRMVDDKPAYDAIIYIANWPEVRTYAWTNLLQARAIENQAYVIGVNRVGFDGNNMAHSGESAVLGPQGKHILSPILQSEKMVTIGLNFDSLRKARAVFPVLLDADTFSLTD